MTAAKTEPKPEAIEAKAAGTLPPSKAHAKTATKRAASSGARKPVNPSPKKPDIILKLVKRSKGARMQDLQKATGWQAHSIWAALTGLRKQGVRIDHSRTPSGKTIYKAVEG
ncbi:DUF3489 domain-containing protein [Sneathiella sp. HT1-7]|uniref:DUF3489 domain-containing protein n=1 Tax=Sneathiella sp. HT1-7 TaxID=2887192 RepID=UPI001D13D86B|nr:DUF3489 domain-containing protein [Sneathiella sp. HT1-7]MCC3305101.1 DUF3489 domain-containing protein [Sneathiella sp. HT1-7]